MKSDFFSPWNLLNPGSEASPWQTGCAFILLLPILLPLSYCSQFFNKEISYEEHYERAEKARKDWREQIKKDLIISKIQILKNMKGEAEINYTLTNSSNRDICRASLELTFRQNGELRKSMEYPSLGCLNSRTSEKIIDRIWWKYDGNNFSDPKLEIKDIVYRDACFQKVGWTRDLECNYIHGTDYLLKPSAKRRIGY